MGNISVGTVSNEDINMVEVLKSLLLMYVCMYAGVWVT